MRIDIEIITAEDIEKTITVINELKETCGLESILGKISLYVAED